MCDRNKIICLHIKIHIYAHINQIRSGENVLLAYCCHLVAIILHTVCHGGGTSKRVRTSYSSSLFLSCSFLCLSDPLAAQVMHPDESEMRCFGKPYMGSLGCC